jgi:hypothetical protein
MIYRIFTKLLQVSILLAVSNSTPAQAQQIAVKQVNLAYIAQRADVIVQGHIVSVIREPLPGYPKIPTIKVTISVQDMMRGPADIKNYSFREFAFDFSHSKGKKSYAAGQQLLLFLTSPSRYGLSGAVGIEQGRFHIDTNSGGAPLIINERKNAGLFRDVEQTVKKAGRKLTKIQSRVASTQHGPVNLEDFVSLVKTLTLLPRIK